MMPLLFILLIVLVVCSLMLPGASKGVEFLFRPDFSKVSSSTFLEALGQAFFSLSIAMGCLCTYASYFKRDTNLLGVAFQISAIDTLVAVLAGLMIFPAALSVGVTPDAGPPLIFITLPNVFEQAFGSLPLVEYVVSVAFYVLLAIAALTSNISLHEVSTRSCTRNSISAVRRLPPSCRRSASSWAFCAPCRSDNGSGRVCSESRCSISLTGSRPTFVCRWAVCSRASSWDGLWSARWWATRLLIGERTICASYPFSA